MQRNGEPAPGYIILGLLKDGELGRSTWNEELVIGLYRTAAWDVTSSERLAGFKFPDGNSSDLFKHTFHNISCEYYSKKFMMRIDSNREK